MTDQEIIKDLIYCGAKYHDKPHQLWNSLRLAAISVGDTEAATQFNQYYTNGDPHLQKLKYDIEHAVKQAKEYVADYPLEINSASEAVWALGQGYKGRGLACDDLHKTIDSLRKSYGKLAGSFISDLIDDINYGREEFEDYRPQLERLMELINAEKSSKNS